MHAWCRTKVQRAISICLLVVLVVSNVVVSYIPVYAATSTLVTDQIKESSSLPQDKFSYSEFRTIVMSFVYSGGEVCLSKTSGMCDPIQVDDGIKVWVNGTFYKDYPSRTQPVHILIPTNLVHTGSNDLKVVLYDMQGPSRGTSPIYVVSSTSSLWYNNCNATDFPKAQVEVVYPSTPSTSYIYRYSSDLHSCPNFHIGYNPPDGNGPYSLSASALVNGTNYDMEFDSNGSMTNVGMSLSYSWTPVARYGGNYIEAGVKYQRNFGSESIGLVGEQSQEVVERDQNRNPPPAERYTIAPNIEPKKANNYIQYFVVAGSIAYILTEFPGLVGLPASVIPQMQLYLQQVTGAPTPATVQSAESIVKTASVLADVQTAVNTRMHSLSKFTAVGSLVGRDKISAFTVFSYMGGGFKPNGDVFVSFGIPDRDDLFWQVLRADGAGNISSSITMPKIDQTPLSKYLLLATDMSSVVSSLSAMFADPNHATIAVNAAAKLIDVVQDVTPPVTTSFAKGPLDVNRVFKDNVTISFQATDDLSGVDHTEYSLNNGQAWTSLPVDGTFTLSGNGITSFLYRSVDKYGNVEAAKDSGPIAISKYVVFTNDASTSLSLLTNTAVAINGTMHTNGNAAISMNTNVQLNGTLEAALSGSQVTYNTSTNVPIVTRSALPMLSYPMASYQKMATTVYPSSVTFNSTTPNLSGIYYVNGDVTIRSATLAGDVTIVATGSIYDQATSTSIVSSDPNNGITLYAGRDISVQGTTNKAVGLFYAPNGTVLVNAATSLTLNGSMVAKAVIIKNSSQIAIKYAPGFLASTYQLPLTATQEPRAANVQVNDEAERQDHPLYLPLINR